MVEIRFPYNDFKYDFDGSSDFRFYVVNLDENRKYIADEIDIKISSPLGVDVKDPINDESLVPNPVNFDIAGEYLYPNEGFEVNYKLFREEKLDYDEKDEIEVSLAYRNRPFKKYIVSVEPDY